MPRFSKKKRCRCCDVCTVWAILDAYNFHCQMTSKWDRLVGYATLTKISLGWSIISKEFSAFLGFWKPWWIRFSHQKLRNMRGTESLQAWLFRNHGNPVPTNSYLRKCFFSQLFFGSISVSTKSYLSGELPFFCFCFKAFLQVYRKRVIKGEIMPGSTSQWGFRELRWGVFCWFFGRQPRKLYYLVL